MKIVTQGDGATVRLGGDHTRLVACKLVQEAPDGWIVQVGKPPRTLKQSARYWATCGRLRCSRRSVVSALACSMCRTTATCFCRRHRRAVPPREALRGRPG